MKRVAFVIFTISAASAGYLTGLEQRYGRPVSETFRVRPNIGVTTRRASDGRVLEMLVAPLDFNGLMASRQTTMKSEAAESVVNELAPEFIRGKYIVGTFLNVQCLPENDCAGAAEDYEQVHITYNSARESGKVRYVSIQFRTNGR